jgi:tetratricopeptide (TPR) repeat protein
LPLSGLAGQLSNERDRLDVLTTDDHDTAVRAAFSLSYRALTTDAARAFRLLGLHPGREFSIMVAAALFGMSLTSAGTFLGTLTSAHLVEAIDDERYRMHDLLAVYASERAAREEDEESHVGAVRRMLSWYLHTADAADRLLIPGRPRPPLGDVPGDCRPLSFSGYDEAFAWCESERENLVASTLRADFLGEYVIAWQLPAALGCYLLLSRRWQAWIDTHETGIRAARRVSDQAAEAWLLSRLGSAYGDLRRYEQAEDCFRRALAIRQAEGDRAGQGPALGNLGMLMGIQGRPEQGIGYLEEALAIMRETGDRYGEGMALNNLGQSYRETGRQDDALSLLREALVIFEDTGDAYNHAMVLDGISDVYRDTGRENDALTLLHQALELRRQVGDRQGEALTLSHIAEIHQAKGEAAEAQRHWQLALALLEELGDPDADRIRSLLAVNDGTDQ